MTRRNRRDYSDYVNPIRIAVDWPRSASVVAVFRGTPSTGGLIEYSVVVQEAVVSQEVV